MPLLNRQAKLDNIEVGNTRDDQFSFFVVARKFGMEDGLVRWTMQEVRKLASDRFGSRESGRIKEPLEATVISSPPNPASPAAVERKKNSGRRTLCRNRMTEV
jgi:hypothetical protein